MEQKRPFFSIIVPCYNSRNTIGTLLDSIVEQKMSKEDLEVVLADDCSTESYQDIVDRYLDKLNIKQVSTEYNCCPGNTRQCGVDAAAGQWIVFADHDDYFIPDVFNRVKQDIEQLKVNTIYYSHFVKINPETNTEKEMPVAGWTHGKFFNRDNFWDKYHLHYIKDLKSHEDISISSQLNCIFGMDSHIEVINTNLITYKWVQKDDSITNKIYYDKDGVERPFLDIFFRDYLTSTVGIYKERYLNKEISAQFALLEIREVMLYSYFYTEGNLFRVGNQLKENYQEVRKYLQFLNNQFGVTIQDIYHHFQTQGLQAYKNIFQICKIAVDIFPPEHSFKEWLDLIYNRKYEKA